MVSWLVPCQGHCVVFLGKIWNFHSAFYDRIFQDFPNILENAIIKFQDFPGFSGPLRTLIKLCINLAFLVVIIDFN